jgi:heterotetrameric sarcosine oxidase gamma subunit
MVNTRISPLVKLLDTALVPEVLTHPSDLVKLGVKGPGLDEWARRCDIALPEALYDTLPVGRDGVLARVGSGELILESAADDPLLGRFAEALQAADGEVYRIEQQSVTVVLSGECALGILAQTCGVDFAAESVGRIVYTRVAGAACAVLPREEDGQRAYRLWVDYSLAPYLWETLAEIALDLRF